MCPAGFARAGGQVRPLRSWNWIGKGPLRHLGLCRERSQGRPLQLASRGSLNPQQMLPELPSLISPDSLEKSYSLQLLSHRCWSCARTSHCPARSGVSAGRPMNRRALPFPRRLVASEAGPFTKLSCRVSGPHQTSSFCSSCRPRGSWPQQPSCTGQGQPCSLAKSSSQEPQ